MGLSLLSSHSDRGKEKKLQAMMASGRAIPGIHGGVSWTRPLRIGDTVLHSGTQKSIESMWPCWCCSLGDALLFGAGKSLLLLAGCRLLHGNITLCSHRGVCETVKGGDTEPVCIQSAEKKKMEKWPPTFIFLERDHFAFLCNAAWKENTFLLIALSSNVVLLDKCTWLS